MNGLRPSTIVWILLLFQKMLCDFLKTKHYRGHFYTKKFFCYPSTRKILLSKITFSAYRIVVAYVIRRYLRNIKTQLNCRSGLNQPEFMWDELFLMLLFIEKSKKSIFKFWQITFKFGKTINVSQKMVIKDYKELFKYIINLTKNVSAFYLM